MVLAQCTWCGRFRQVEFHLWHSPKTGEQLVGDVCRHCYHGGTDDDCRTCKVKREKGLSEGIGKPAVRPVEGSDIPKLLEGKNNAHPRTHRR